MEQKKSLLEQGASMSDPIIAENLISTYLDSTTYSSFQKLNLKIWYMKNLCMRPDQFYKKIRISTRLIIHMCVCLGQTKRLSCWLTYNETKQLFP